MKQFNYGTCVRLYDHACAGKPSKQLEMINVFFPGILIEEIKKKDDSEYDEYREMIRASRVHGTLYIGNSRHVTLLAGQLCGTSEGNPTKQRKNACLLRRAAVNRILKDSRMPELLEIVKEKLQDIGDPEQFRADLKQYILACAQEETGLTEEVKAGILVRAMEQLCLGQTEKAYAWLLCGTLFQDASARLLTVYDSSWQIQNPLPKGDLFTIVSAMAMSIGEHNNLPVRYNEQQDLRKRSIV